MDSVGSIYSAILSIGLFNTLSEIMVMYASE